MINVAVVGLGYWGPNLVRNFIELDQAQVVACCDRDSSRLGKIKKRVPLAKLTDDFNQVLENPDVDAVCIATPVSTHFELVRQALEAGKHVLVEKPMAASVEQAEQLVDLADAKHKVLMVGHTFEYHGAVNKIKEIIETGQLGDPLYFDSVRINLGLFQHDINVIWDLVPHDASIFYYLIGREPRRISAQGVSHFGDVENIAYVTLEFDGPLIAHFHVNWLAPAKMRLILIGGTKQMIVYDDLQPTEKIRVYDKGVERLSDRGAMARLKWAYRSGDMHAPVFSQAEALRTECGHFLQCIETDRTPRSDGRSGLRVVKLLEAAQKSLRLGGEAVDL